MNLTDESDSILRDIQSASDSKEYLPEISDLTDFDFWILLRLQETVQQMDRNIKAYRIGDAASLVYDFIWKEFCDWYIELAKKDLNQDTSDDAKKARIKTQRVLLFVLENSLKILHPFMPFITEEIYSFLHETDRVDKSDQDSALGKLLIAAQWPDVKNWDFWDTVQNQESNDSNPKNIQKRVTAFQEIIYQIRNIRGEMNIGPGVFLAAAIVPDKQYSDFYQRIAADYQDSFLSIAKLERIVLDMNFQLKKTDARGAIEGATVAVMLEGIIDLDKEKARLKKEVARMEKEVTRLQKKLANQEFLANAPDHVVSGEQKKLQDYEDLKARYFQSLQNLISE